MQQEEILIHCQSQEIQCVVIDQRIGWYGSVNLIGRSLADANVVRMTSPEFTNALIDALGL